MAESRIRNAFSRSTILTVGRLLAFISVGFAVGLLIGVVSEEPELLAGHLRGDTDTVELDAALAARPDDDEIAAAAALAARVTKSESGLAVDELEARHDDAPTLMLPDVGAGPANGASEEGGFPVLEPAATAPVGSENWAIQVGAFGDSPSAQTLADRLEGKGYPIEILPASAESNRWRVRVQPIDGESSARATAEKIEREERLPTWVIRLEGLSRP